MSLVSLVIILSSCASRNAGWDKNVEAVKLSDKEYSALKENALKHWKGRVDQVQLETSLDQFNKLHSAKPENLENLIKFRSGGNDFNPPLFDAHKLCHKN